MAEMIRSAAVLQVRDVVEAAAFYQEKLGFTTAGMWGESPCFSIVGRGTVTLFLDQAREDGPIPLNQYWAAYIYVDDVDAYLEELKSRDVEIVRGPENMDHGCREIDVKDLDGHIIAFGQDLTPGPVGPGL